MNMEVQDLLRPRYKVIADYPRSKFKIGQVLYRDDKHENNYWTGDQCYTNVYPDKYKNIFQKLSWQQFRSDDELPEYVKDLKGNWVAAVNKHYSNYDDRTLDLKDSKGNIVTWYYSQCLPATLTDYTQSINQK